MPFRTMAALAALLLLAPLAHAQADDEPLTEEDLAAMQATVDSLLAPLDWHTGTIDLGGGVATLEVPEGYRYLDAEDAAYVLEELWGNPPAETWGMLFPEQAGPLDMEGWGIDIVFLADGYVSDEDAAEIDYDELLATMQDDTAAESDLRAEQGYQRIELLGWAAPPFYDADGKKLHWAKEIAFEGDEVRTLNYNIRFLGRRGVLMLNAIGTMDQLAEVETAVPPVLGSIAFNSGHRYSDFNPEIDDVAAYGIAGLVAGKVLTKVGIFAGILKFWKVLLAAGVGAFALLRRRFFGEKAEPTDRA